MAYCLRPRRHLTILAPLFVTSLVLLSLSGTAAQTETWIRQFGTPFSDEANDAVIDGSGNLYVVGHTGGVLPDQVRAGGLRDAYVIKYDSNGNRLWIDQFGSIGGDGALAAAVDGGGNLYVVGQMAGDNPGQAVRGR